MVESSISVDTIAPVNDIPIIKTTEPIPKIDCSNILESIFEAFKPTHIFSESTMQNNFLSFCKTPKTKPQKEYSIPSEYLANFIETPEYIAHYKEYICMESQRQELRTNRKQNPDMLSILNL